MPIDKDIKLCAERQADEQPRNKREKKSVEPSSDCQEGDGGCLIENFAYIAPRQAGKRRVRGPVLLRQEKSGGAFPNNAWQK